MTSLAIALGEVVVISHAQNPCQETNKAKNLELNKKIHETSRILFPSSLFHPSNPAPHKKTMKNHRKNQTKNNNKQHQFSPRRIDRFSQLQPSTISYGKLKSHPHTKTTKTQKPPRYLKWIFTSKG